MLAYLHERMVDARTLAVSNKLRRSNARAFTCNPRNTILTMPYLVRGLPPDFRPDTWISITQDVRLIHWNSVAGRDANAIVTILFPPRFLFLCFTFSSLSILPTFGRCVARVRFLRRSLFSACLCSTARRLMRVKQAELPSRDFVLADNPVRFEEESFVWIWRTSASPLYEFL